MTNAEWRQELQRITRMAAARREYAFDEADTKSALAKIGAETAHRAPRERMIQTMTAKGM